jgi:hypothetical protein
MIEAWVKDDTGTVMNPFVLERKGMSWECIEKATTLMMSRIRLPNRSRSAIGRPKGRRCT